MKVKTERDMDFVRHRFTPIRNELLNKNSEAESHFERLLVQSGLYFRREKCNFRYNTRWSYYDFYIPFYNLFVEIDGESHNNEQQKLIDKEKEEIVRNKQKFIVRLTNEEVLSMDVITIEMLLEKSFQQSAAKRKKKGAGHSKNRYNAVMTSKREKGKSDLMRDANFYVDEEQCIWLYDHSIGEYFCFNNIIEAKFSVEMSVNQIHELCEMKQYNKCNSRRFVFAYTQADCENRVMQTYY